MDKKLIVVLGGLILCVGTFLPLANASSTSVSFMMPGDGDAPVVGIMLAACGALGVLLALIGHARHAVWFGLVALALVVWKFLQLKNLMDQASAMTAGVELPPEVAAQMPTMNMLGWGVLGLGALIMVIGGAMAWKGGTSAPPPAAV